MLKGKKIILAISGSIAAYKSILLLRLLVKHGADVKVVLTPVAKDFVSPLTLATLSKNEVLENLANNNSWANHVMLGRWADAMIIAPLSCNTLAKMALGICDNLFMAVYLSATCPVLFAPAMDEDMWMHPATKNNIKIIQSYGNILIKPNNGELASGLVGEGRMAEPDEIISSLDAHFLNQQNNDLSDKSILVTAGSTHEKLDPVRYIGNHSSGKMGVAIAQECALRGAKVTLVLGPNSIEIPKNKNINTVLVESADEMFTACNKIFSQTDIAIMAAAVADYKPAQKSITKIKKKEHEFSLQLVKNIDILKTLGLQKTNAQCLVGFALETNNEIENATEKLNNKNADFIVLNSLQQGNIFGADNNTITIIGKNNFIQKFENKSKKIVAKDIIDTLLAKYK